MFSIYSFIYADSLKEAARIVNMLNLEVVNTTTLQQQMTGAVMEEPVEKKNTVCILIKWPEEEFVMLVWCLS